MTDANAMQSWLERPLGELANAVARGDVSAEEITRASLSAIESRNPSLGAFLAVAAEMALDQAPALRRHRGRATQSSRRDLAGQMQHG